MYIELPCILHKTRGFLMLYVFYITTTPYLPCNNDNINRKELYDFYYTAITWNIMTNTDQLSTGEDNYNNDYIIILQKKLHIIILSCTVLSIEYRGQYRFILVPSVSSATAWRTGEQSLSPVLPLILAWSFMNGIDFRQRA